MLLILSIVISFGIGYFGSMAYTNYRRNRIVKRADKLIAECQAEREGNE